MIVLLHSVSPHSWPLVVHCCFHLVNFADPLKFRAIGECHCSSVIPKMAILLRICFALCWQRCMIRVHPFISQSNTLQFVTLWMWAMDSYLKMPLRCKSALKLVRCRGFDNVSCTLFPRFGCQACISLWTICDCIFELSYLFCHVCSRTVNRVSVQYWQIKVRIDANFDAEMHLLPAKTLIEPLMSRIKERSISKLNSV